MGICLLMALEVYADVHIPNYNQDCAVLSHSRIKSVRQTGIEPATIWIKIRCPYLTGY